MTVRDLEFDQLARTLSTTTSRRQAFKVFGVATVGGVASLFGASSAKAAGRCFVGGHGCRENEECCSKFCDPATAQCACQAGTFLCPSTGFCVGCGPGQVFDATTCECECPTGSVPVGDTCCQNPVTCGGPGGGGSCCPGFRCDPKTDRCMPCMNPPSCKSSAECCSGYFCADNPFTSGGICAPEALAP